MRKWIGALLVAAFACGIPPSAQAVIFEWDWPQTNADGSNLTDLAGARLYTCPAAPCTKANGTLKGTIAAPAPDPATGAVGTFNLTEAIAGIAFVTAFDTSGNESAESNTVPFDGIAPTAPTQFRKR